MISTQHKEIFRLLIEKTVSGKLKWQKTSLTDKYVIQLLGYDVSISCVNKDGDITSALMPEKASVEFLDVTGNAFDTITAYDFASEEYREIAKLYEVARRSALDIDRKLSDILGQLK